jgi:RNA polymerase sigma-70 factor (ECF subfamily)
LPGVAGIVDQIDIKRFEAHLMPRISNVGGVADTGDLFDSFKERLRRMVRLRLDRRLSGIVDSSGVLGLAREEAIRLGTEPKSDSVAANPFLWLRRITGEVMAC